MMGLEYKFTTYKAKATGIDDLCRLEEKIFQHSDRFSRRRLRYLLSSKNAIVRFCYSGSFLIGYGISLVNNLRNSVCKGRIYSIGILRDYQVRGAGSALLRAMEADLKRFSVQFITLETRKDRKGATEFFARHGYRKVQELPKYYASEPGIRMRKEVDQKEACVQRAAH